MTYDPTMRSKPHVERHARQLRKFQAERDERRSFNAVLARMEAETMAKSGAVDGDEKDDLMTDDIAKAHRDRGAGGHRSLTGALLEHLHDRLERRREQHGYTKSVKDDPPMDTIHSFMKDAGIAGVCAQIVAKGTTTLTELQIVESVSKIAPERYPELSEPQAFSKIYSDGGEEGRVLRSAINVAKASLAETMLGPGLPVTVVGGSAAQDVNNATEAEQARAELMRIGRKQWPRLTENEVFERAFTDPRNATLVARLYQRPLPTSIYPMPREWLQGEGSQHEKADRGTDSAYDELMLKAEAYRDAHSELSISQAFAKVFTDPANVELASRERRENAAR
jgi:hypothetical protein